MLENVDLHMKDIRVNHNLYWEQMACMQIENKFSEVVESHNQSLPKKDLHKKKE